MVNKKTPSVAGGVLRVRALPLRSAHTTSRHPAKRDGGSRRDDLDATAHDANIANCRCRVKALARKAAALQICFLLAVPAKADVSKIDDRLDQRSAAFETAASQLPQDEEFP